MTSLQKLVQIIAGLVICSANTLSSHSNKTGCIHGKSTSLLIVTSAVLGVFQTNNSELIAYFSGV